jgi:hypothetical protein
MGAPKWVRAGSVVFIRQKLVPTQVELNQIELVSVADEFDALAPSGRPWPTTWIFRVLASASGQSRRANLSNCPNERDAGCE